MILYSIRAVFVAFSLVVPDPRYLGTNVVLVYLVKVNQSEAEHARSDPAETILQRGRAER